jgi:hypothetical protein
LSISLAEMPPAAAQAGLQLRDAAIRIFDDDLTAMWVDGGITFPDRPLVPGDLDVWIVLTNVTPKERDPGTWRNNPQSRPVRLLTAQHSVEAEHGRSIDAGHLLVEETGGHDQPSAAFNAAGRHGRWSVVRAHWLAGQYVHLHGRRPEELVVAPRQDDLRRELSREIEHLERHVYEGDAADPYEATFAIWNGCRVLYTLTTGSPVISKRSAGAWALANLPERWHPAVHAAGRSYDGVATEDDNELLRVTMPPFVAMLREQLPYATPRPPGHIPRWG